MKKLPKIVTLKFKLSASKKLAKIGGSSKPLEPPLVMGLDCNQEAQLQTSYKLIMPVTASYLTDYVPCMVATIDQSDNTLNFIV